MLLTISKTLSTNYLNNILTTIEKRFKIENSISKLITTSYKFKSLITIIFINYLKKRHHIPI